VAARRWVPAFGLAGALPSLIWAFGGAGLIHDDWDYANSIHFTGWLEALRYRALVQPARPLQGVWYTVTFGLFHVDPLPHALGLAALNGVAAALVFVIADRLWGRRIAIATALAWVVLPNRGSARLWFSVAPAMLALCLLLIGVLLLLNQRPWAATVLLTASVLTYESVVALALAAVVVRTVRRHPDRWRRGILMAGALAGAAAYIWSRSPKRGTPVHVFGHATSWVSSLLGAGVFGAGWLPRIGGLAIAIWLGVAVIRVVLPGFDASSEERVALHGLVVLGLGLAPFLGTGFPVATDGIFDRANILPDLGLAVVLGSLLVFLYARARPALPIAALLFVIVPAVLNARDLSDYRRAVTDGERVQARLATDVPPFNQPLVIGPPLNGKGGVAQFITDWDTTAYIQLKRDDPRLHARMAVSDEDWRTAPDPLRYDRLRRRFTAQGPAPGTPPGTNP
jgi:hypothetical protein